MPPCQTADRYAAAGSVAVPALAAPAVAAPAAAGQRSTFAAGQRSTLPALMHEVHTYSRRGDPLTFARTR
jgi:hypothetical protein